MPAGALHVLDYGTGWGSGDASSAVYRIEYDAGGGRAPIAAATADPTTGNAPLTVQFSSAGTIDPDGDAITYAWDFTTNGSTDFALCGSIRLAGGDLRHLSKVTACGFPRRSTG
ncbi:hypothetical protein O7632_00875 [Solwaraspora sp. WMMD406]|uniref:hypothetical protein n=1 Tax=Solwaraspora sp. WMMD406 TaxID=3016095 RepID=UPI002416F7D1|nr:hypothetical protein [Solwaraspora sp. WMMD406]MDG4762676.1 hypothetical protein [Solwaraspora sp. WMMD406]